MPTAKELVVRQPFPRALKPTSARVLPSRVWARVRRASTGYRRAWAIPRLQPPDTRRCGMVRGCCVVDAVDVVAVLRAMDFETTRETIETNGSASIILREDDLITPVIRLRLHPAEFGDEWWWCHEEDGVRDNSARTAATHIQRIIRRSCFSMILSSGKLLLVR
jgi:hypothetical protein